MAVIGLLGGPGPVPRSRVSIKGKNSLYQRNLDEIALEIAQGRLDSIKFRN